MKGIRWYRFFCLMGLGGVVTVGVAKTLGNNWGLPLVMDASGDVLYELAWIWLIGAWKVRWPVFNIAAGVWIATCLIELSQLIDFPSAWTQQLWWRLLLGTHFSWPDFIYYLVGCSLGYISLLWLRLQCGLSPSERSV